jgi:ornithine carbamoyltransferase
MNKDLISINDLNKEEALELLELAAKLKSGAIKPSLNGKTLALVFEKPSLRTRVTFEAGMTQLSGHAIYLTRNDIQIGERETVSDAAKNLERWVDAIAARTFAHKTVVELAQNAKVPVINALSDYEHPCQALADFLTIKEHKQRLDGLKIVYVGDANNVCNSLYLLAAVLGVNFVVSAPEGYRLTDEIVQAGRDYAKKSGAQLEMIDDPLKAVENADVIYTDVWVSMGQEEEKEERVKVFEKYQVNSGLVEKAKDDVIVMHCLPAKRGYEITDEVLDGPHSVVFDEAENRLHAQKALLVKLMKSI